MKIKTLVVLTIAVLSQATANVALSSGMRTIAQSVHQQAGHFLSFPIAAVTNPLIWTGILLSLVFFALFSAALSWTDLSFVLPVISFEVVINVAFAALFLHEPVSLTRWAGTLLISIGVIFVIRSGKETDHSTLITETAASNPAL